MLCNFDSYYTSFVNKINHNTGHFERIGKKSCYFIAKTLSGPQNRYTNTGCSSFEMETEIFFITLVINSRSLPPLDI